jgi:transposase
MIAITHEMPAIPQEIEAYQVQHLPLIKAYADQLGVVNTINHYVPTEMDVDAGTIVLGLVLDTLSGRSPLYRLEEFFSHQDTELLLGKALPPNAFNDDQVGRVLDRLYDFGTMRLFTSCAVRAAAQFGLDRRYVHFDTTSRNVYGAYQRDDREAPFTLTYGYSKDKRPDLKQFILSTLCVDRAVPIWGKPEDGNASDKSINTTILSEISQIMGRYGVAPGAYIYIADSAMVTETNLESLGETLFISRLPATYGECERIIAEAVSAESWQEVGVLAQTKPTKNRPAASYKVWEGTVTLYGKPYRAVVGHSSSQDQRRQKRLEGEVKASRATLEARAREAAKPTYFCQADAAAAAESLQARGSAYHRVEVEVEERPTYGPGRPSATKPRTVKALHYGLKVTVHEQPEVMARKSQEAGCFVLLSNVPSEGEMAHSAQEVLSAYKEQHGIEQNYGFLKDPLIVNSLFLDKPERIEALGMVILLALLIWRLMERSLRQYVETSGTKLVGWDRKPTDRPTTFMMLTKFSGVMVLKIGMKRQLARPLSGCQQQYLTALGISAACYTGSSG